MKTPFRYEPSGDVDGDLVGTDHFVMDRDGNELACPPDEDTARLFAAAPDLLEACEAVVEQDGFVGSALMRKRVQAMKAAVAKARGYS